MNYFGENFYDEEKRQLNLSHRNMRSLAAAVVETFAHLTEYLDLSHNLIRNMTWIYEFPHLRCLIMDNNRLREAHFEALKQPLPKIHTLMLNKNELSDLEATADILQRLFPNVEYLSLHGNAMCPDNLLLQPFCDFVPYEYNHYRTILLKSLPNLKFLDHFSLDSKMQVNEHLEQQHQQQQQRHTHLLLSFSKDLWSKVKSFVTVIFNQTATDFSISANDNCALHCAASSNGESYGLLHSESNRFVSSSDL